MGQEDSGLVGMEWCIAQPKIELHAHLNGSIRDSTLLELAKESVEKGVLVFSDVEYIINKCNRSVVECFKLFDLVRTITTNHAIISRITKEVIEDFSAENVVYLELRTTPKNNELVGMNKRSYMEAVMDGIRAVETVEVLLPSYKSIGSPKLSPSTNDASKRKERSKLFVRLLLSIDRHESTHSALETVHLALEMRNVGVVGIDLAGNPLVGNWSAFLPALKCAREEGLAITLHCGEVFNPDEIKAMLDFGPQRIGHACCLGGQDWMKLKSLDIPVMPLAPFLLENQSRFCALLLLNFWKLELLIYLLQVEICLSSNVQTGRVSSIQDHHFDPLYRTNHPVVICTDDTGIFSTSLSQEYYLAASAFGLSKAQLFELSKNAIKYVFADDSVKLVLSKIFESFQRRLQITLGGPNA